MADIQHQIAGLAQARAAASAAVVLDRVVLGTLPEYCTHGRATCGWCGAWCWLGSATHDEVTDGHAAPICKECANRHVRPGAAPVQHVRDHRRADGPHT